MKWSDIRQSLFSPDSKFMRVMSRVADLMILNLVFLFTCIPVVTIGAASTALYTVCFRFGTHREGKLVRTYFRAFRGEFKRGTLLWLMILLCGSTAALNAYVFYLMPGALHWAFVLFAILFVLMLLIASYVFPLLSQFDNGVGATFTNALILGLGYLPRSVVITAFNVFPLALLLDLYGFFQLGFLWIALYFSTAAYANTILLKKIFAPYLPENSDEGQIKEEENA